MRFARSLTTAVAPMIVLLLTTLSHAQGLVVDGSGNVGVGTTTPTEKLEVNGTIAASGTSTSDLLYLINNGNIATAHLVTNNAHWTLRNHANGEFRITEASATLVPLRLTSAGNLTISGTLVQGSSRSIKSNIESVNDVDMLDRVLKLPVYEWQYTADETNDRQVGPMAEDFQQAFGLGDGEHISVATASGVSLSAIRGLNQRFDARSAQLELLIREKQNEIDALRRANDAFAERLAALESRGTTKR